MRVRVLELSSVRSILPWLSELMTPVKVEPLLRLRARLEMESTTMLPVAVWFKRFMVTVPPLAPDLPQESF